MYANLSLMLISCLDKLHLDEIVPTVPSKYKDKDAEIIWLRKYDLTLNY
jgi:hypothetical protein